MRAGVHRTSLVFAVVPLLLYRLVNRYNNLLIIIIKFTANDHNNNNENNN